MVWTQCLFSRLDPRGALTPRVITHGGALETYAESCTLVAPRFAARGRLAVLVGPLNRFNVHTCICIHIHIHIQIDNRYISIYIDIFILIICIMSSHF